MKFHSLALLGLLISALLGSRPVLAQMTLPDLTAGNMSGKPGDMVNVPVLLGKVSMVAAASFTVDFSVSNPTGAPALTLGMNATPGALATGALFAANPVGTQYRVALAAAINGMSQALISGPGVLFTIPVTIPTSAAPGTFYTITVQDVDLEDSTPSMIPATVGTGTLTVASAVSAVQVSPNPASIAAGSTLTFSASALDSGMQPVPAATFTWSVAAGATAGVSIDAMTGVLTASSPGTALVQAASGGVVGTAAVTVIPGAPASVTLSPPTVAATAGATQQFTAVVKDAQGNAIPNAALTWTADSSIGTISPITGLFSATTAGMGQVTATAGTVSGSAVVTVSPGAPVSVTVSPPTATLTAGGTQQFTAVVKDAQGNVISGAAVAWSADASAGTIGSATGLLTASASGMGKVTATVGSVSGTAAVAVTGMPALSVPGLQNGRWVRGILSITPGITGLVPTSVQVSADGSATALASAAAEPFVLSLDTTMLPDGSHALTFAATGAATQSVQATVTVNVLNTPPTATLTAPAPNQNVRRMVSVTGTADAAVSGGFANYALVFAPGDTTTNAASVGAIGTSAVHAGTLGTWDTSSLVPGPYTLVLTVTDLAGNQTQAHELVNVVPFVTGDLNGDGKVTVADATLAVRIAVGLIQPTPDQLAAGDLHHQGAITIGDATLILRAAVHLVVLPA